MKRAHINLKKKLATALLQHLRYDDEQAALVPVISYKEAKSMTADQIIARFHLDHNILHSHDGPDEPWNLTWMPVEEHRRKTADIDVPRAAKAKRVRAGQEDFRRRVLAKDNGEPKPKSRWPKRKMQSRNSFQQRAQA